ncbi:recombinase family protein [Patescibacteria group bacterium]|nr:recombinase family protein [Patescibacteria group bacterium]
MTTATLTKPPSAQAERTDPPTQDGHTETEKVKYCLYARKSSEDDERQAMSIDSQIAEMMTIAKREGLKITEVRRESHSAKASGHRPVYNTLLEDIQKGLFGGILTWAPDRLSRNAGDLGTLVDLMDRGQLKEIRCHSQRFTNNPNEKFLLMILCSQAKLENDNRGINVKRGMKARAEMGYRPCMPGLGYLTERKPGENRSRVTVDPVRAPFIKEMYEKVAYEKMSGRDLHKRICDAGFRTRAGKMLTLSMVYKVLHNAYYTSRFEYPIGSGKWYQGDHEPLVSQQLFDEVQRCLSDGQTKDWGSKEFAFTRLMTCGHCGSGVTADEKRKTLKNGEQRRYVYYRCTKTRGRDCKAPPVREEDLIEQLIELLDGLDLNATAVKRKIDDEFERFSRFASDVLGISNQKKAKKISQRKYVEYLLRKGTMGEKRALLENLRSKLLLRNGELLQK